MIAEEVRNLEPNYSPDSVNIDGWEATRNAWKKLFSKISIILCFLHLVLGIKDYLRRDKSLLNTIKDKCLLIMGKVKGNLPQRLRRFWEWSIVQILPQKVHSKIERAKAYSHQFQQAYNYEHCYRSSNQIDRLMNYQDRIL